MNPLTPAPAHACDKPISPASAANPLADLYCQLGLVMDGIWFLELEKRVGFDKAYEIDEAVWRIYPRKEAKRIRTHLGLIPGQPITLTQLSQCFSLALFNQTLGYELAVVTAGIAPGQSTRGLVLDFKVKTCKSCEGMRKMGRSPNQIHKICKGIETVTLTNFLDELVPGVKVTCNWCPHEEQNKLAGSEELCSWRLTFPD